MNHTPGQGRGRTIWVVACFVLLWRLAAAVSPYREGALASMTSDTLNTRLGLGAMGILFMACGVYAYARRRNRVVMLFALYACSGGLHWGGPIHFSNPSLEAALFLFYLVASGVLSETFLLHFILLYTGISRKFSDKKWFILYLPALVLGLLGTAILFLPADSARSKTLLGILTVLLGIGLLLALAGMAVLAYRAARPIEGGPPRRDLLWILAAYAMVTLITLLPSYGFADTTWENSTNFAYIIIPLAIACVIVRRGHQPTRT